MTTEQFSDELPKTIGGYLWRVNSQSEPHLCEVCYFTDELHGFFPGATMHRSVNEMKGQWLRLVSVSCVEAAREQAFKEGYEAGASFLCDTDFTRSIVQQAWEQFQAKRLAGGQG